jgi:hypothetical protein
MAASKTTSTFWKKKCEAPKNGFAVTRPMAASKTARTFSKKVLCSGIFGHFFLKSAKLKHQP